MADAAIGARPGSRPGLQQIQYAFTAHIRDPQHQPRPADVEERRMAIYRDLLYDNLEGMLSGAFPVLRSLMPDPAWHAMVRDFFVRHRAKSPYFRDIPRELLHYLEQERDCPDDPSYLLQLAHYEWVELALGMSDQRADLTGVDPGGDLLRSVPVLSPLAWPLHYDYAVHRIGPDYRPESPEPTYLVVYRNRNDEVGFLALNQVTMRLLQLITDQPRATGSELLRQIAAELRHPRPEAVLTGGADILEDLRRRDVILGARRAD